MDHPLESDDVPRAAQFLWMPVWLAVMLHSGAWLTFGYWLVGLVGPARQMKDFFADFGVAPGFVVSLLNIAEFTATYWYAGLLAVLLMAAADACIDRWFLHTAQYVIRTLWFLFGFAPPVVLMVIGTIATYSTYFSMWHSVGSAHWTSYPSIPAGAP